MKILIASSELQPFVSSGELAQMVENILCGVSKYKEIEVECVLPLYSMIDESLYNLNPTGKGFQVPVADKLENVEIWEGKHPDCGVRTWFIASRYFERDGLYGNITGDYPDNSERFVFFSRAVLELARIIVKPDVIHCNDWQTALIPLYMKEFYNKNNEMKDVKTVLSLHDIRYQGRFWLYDLYILNLGWEVFSPEKLEFYNDINFLKGGIVYCDAIFVLNIEYLEKISTEDGGCGLEGVVRKYKEKFCTVCADSENLMLEKDSKGTVGERLICIYKKLLQKDKETLVKECS